MKTAKYHSNFWLITGLVSAAVLFRIIPHPFNMTPLIAVSLFSGAKFDDKKYAFMVPVITLLLSDVVLSYMNHYPLLHDTIFFTYGSVLLIALLGMLLKKQSFSIVKTAGLSVLSSLLFFILSNVGVWMFSNLYTPDMAGLVKCFVLAIPFNKFSWIGDMAFSLTLFGIYDLIIVKYYTTKTQAALHNNQEKN